jgi:uncharacterized damage-inducible protein DinB
MTISETLLPQFDAEMASTRAILACVPEDKFTWKPHEKSMTLGRLASHIAEMAQWAVEAINRDKLELTPGTKPFQAQSKAELMETLEKNAAAAHKAIAGATDEQLRQSWSLVYGGQTVFTMPRIAVLRSPVLSHIIHHRGQLSVYLRLNDVAIPGMYGPSADANAFAAGQ